MGSYDKLKVTVTCTICPFATFTTGAMLVLVKVLRWLPLGHKPRLSTEQTTKLVATESIVPTLLAVIVPCKTAGFGRLDPEPQVLRS
jgi:hypothetical protein